MKNVYTSKSAVISECGRFRYVLTRRWADNLPTMIFLMLNPSTADADLDDATIRKCVGFAKIHGCGSIKIINLFALRSRDPKELLTAEDPLGSQYWFYLQFTLDSIIQGDKLVLAWGCDDTIRRKQSLVDHMNRVRLMVAPYIPRCFGLTQGGAPKHPVMLGYKTPLITFQYEDLPCPITQ